MTSTTGRDPLVSAAGVVDGGVGLAPVSLSPPTRRRPSWMAVGALLVGLAGLLGAYVFSVVSDTLSVAVAANDIAPGEVIGPEDIRVVEMGRTSELRALQSNQQDLIIGLAARGPIPEGTVLNTGLFVASDEVIPAGKVVVGAAFEAGAIPTRSLKAGDDVGLVQVVDATTRLGGTDAAAGISELGTAEVWAVEGDVSADSVTSRVWVSLLVDAALRLPISQAAADETLRLVLLGSS